MKGTGLYRSGRLGPRRGPRRRVAARAGGPQAQRSGGASAAGARRPRAGGRSRAAGRRTRAPSARTITASRASSVGLVQDSPLERGRRRGRRGRGWVAWKDFTRPWRRAPPDRSARRGGRSRGGARRGARPPRTRRGRGAAGRRPWRRTPRGCPARAEAQQQQFAVAGVQHLAAQAWSRVHDHGQRPRRRGGRPAPWRRPQTRRAPGRRAAWRARSPGATRAASASPRAPIQHQSAKATAPRRPATAGLSARERALGAVHRGVGVMHELLELVRVVGPQGPADARAHRERVLAELERVVEGVHDARRGGVDLGQSRRLAEDDRELVAARGGRRCRASARSRAGARRPGAAARRRWRARTRR